MSDPQAVAWGDRPRCGRPTQPGYPCQAVVRYSVPLEEFAPACPKHLTPEERTRLANEPLWSPVEQVHWLLDRVTRDGKPLPAFRIAARLQVQQPVVAESLRRLATDGRAAVVPGDRCELWAVAQGRRN